MAHKSYSLLETYHIFTIWHKKASSLIILAEFVVYPQSKRSDSSKQECSKINCLMIEYMNLCEVQRQEMRILHCVTMGMALHKYQFWIHHSQIMLNVLFRVMIYNFPKLGLHRSYNLHVLKKEQQHLADVQLPKCLFL